MRRNNSRVAAQGEFEKIKHHIHEISEILEADDTFSVRDFDIPRNDTKSLLVMLNSNGAIRHVGQTDDNKISKRVNKYEWNPRFKRALEDYRDSLNRLPCGHRAHIYNDPETPEGTLGCKHCEETVRFDQETVKKVI